MLPLVKPKPVTMNQHQISAFSYFYERMIENGLIGKELRSRGPSGNFIFRLFRSLRRWRGDSRQHNGEGEGGLPNGQHGSAVHVLGPVLHRCSIEGRLRTQYQNQYQGMLHPSMTSTGSILTYLAPFSVVQKNKWPRDFVGIGMCLQYVS